MRRIAILVLLYGGILLIQPLERGGHGTGSITLLIFGFLVLGAFTSGELAATVKLPKITGYLLAGLLFGPAALGIVTVHAVGELQPVSELAVAIIAFLAGAELKWGELKARGRGILIVLGSELSLSFVSIVTVLWFLQRFIPFLHGVPPAQVLALCALFAAIAIVHSPAVTMALLSETGARGPVARTTLGVVLVADVVVVLLFSGVLTFVRALVPAPGGAVSGLSLGGIAWEIGGSVLVGAVLGVGVALYLRFVRQELFLFAILVAFFGAEIARITHVETLLTLLVAGFITENATGEEGGELLRAMERSAVPVFVVFFALAGASIHVSELVMLWPLALAVVATRAAAIFTGTRIGATIAGLGEVEKKNVWLGLVSQAGVAIGLAAILGRQYPHRGGEMQTLILSMIAINEIAGQILFKIALVRSGEVPPAAAAAPSGARAPELAAAAETPAARE